MTFDEFCLLPDLDKILLVEAQSAREVEGESWTEDSGAWYCDFSSFTYGEVVVLEEFTTIRTVYINAPTVAGCRGTPSSFYYDYDNQRLYVHTSGSENPSVKDSLVYKYCLLARFWVCVTNRQPSPESAQEDYRTIYAPQGLYHVVYYLPYLHESSMPTVTQGVGNYYVGDLTIQLGKMTFTNDGWWYSAFENMIWHNAPIHIKFGAKGSDYGDFETVFLGVIRNPEVSDEEASFDVQDIRVSSLKDVPLTSFSRVAYPDLEENADGQPIPIAFGKCCGIIPICIEWFNLRYKIAGHAINKIIEVREAGVTLTEGADWWADPSDLANGEFWLVYDPGDHVIECDVEGALCGSSNSYSELFSDFLKYLLVDLNGILEYDLDTATFDELRTSRRMKGGLYVSTYTSSMELIRLFQSSAVFQLVPSLDGIWYVKCYTIGSGNAPVIMREDLESLGILYDTEGVFYKVVVSYLRHPATQEYMKISAMDEKVSHRYGDKKSLEVETALYDPAEAEMIAAYYLATVSAPPKYVTGVMGSIGLNMNPTDKIVLSKTILDAEGVQVQVFDGVTAVYRVLEFRKNFTPADTGFRGIDDNISAGVYHADALHSDSHTDAYTDTPATAHIDETIYEDYSDVTTAIPHVEVAHIDVMQRYHADGSHLGNYTDVTSHEDGNGHWDYADKLTPSTPTYYGDYLDSHYDHHFDYGDYGDGGYYRAWHDDEAHEDMSYQDSHLDSHVEGHGDVLEVPRYIDYGDTHSDTSHADSDIGGGGVSRVMDYVVVGGFVALSIEKATVFWLQPKQNVAIAESVCLTLSGVLFSVLDGVSVGESVLVEVV